MLQNLNCLSVKSKENSIIEQKSGNRLFTSAIVTWNNMWIDWAWKEIPSNRKEMWCLRVSWNSLAAGDRIQKKSRSGFYTFNKHNWDYKVFAGSRVKANWSSKASNWQIIGSVFPDAFTYFCCQKLRLHDYVMRVPVPDTLPHVCPWKGSTCFFLDWAQS